MLLHLLDVSLRSILMAAPAGIVLWLLRRRVPPAWQHAVWSMVVCGMLILLAFGQALPRLPFRVLDASPAPRAVETGITADIAIVPSDNPALPSPKPSNVRPPMEWSHVAASVYAAIALGFLAWFFTGMLLARRVVRSATPLSFDGHANVFESERLNVPATVGWLRPVVLLPPEWRDWPREKLNAVLAHESAHVRRRDGLVAALAGINRCLFWFHPLAWMLERRVALLAERACDECCIATLGDLRGYANVLLEMASVRVEAQGRLRCHALTMAAGSHIRQRIESLLEDGRAFSRGLTWSGWMALMLCGIPLVLCAGAVELAHQPPLLKLEIPRMTVPAPPALPALPPQRPAAQSIQLAQAGKNPTTASADPQQQSDAAADDKLTFEVVSIKLAPPDDGRNMRRVNGDSSERSYENTTLYGLVAEAYPRPEFYKVVGQVPPDAPASQHFNVIVKIPPGTTKPQFKIMLRNMLAQRFGLTAHRETREFAGYDLVVARGGPKLKDAAGFTGPQTPPDPSKPLELDREGFPKLSYPTMAATMSFGPNGVPITHLAARAQPVSTLLSALQNATGMPMHDKTGLTGKYDFNLGYTVGVVATPAGTGSADSPQAADPGVPDIRAAIKNLGLTLEPMKVMLDVLVVDHVEKDPTEN
jgi:uncharacterized protein (TIGR03435 family)